MSYILFRKGGCSLSVNVSFNDSPRYISPNDPLPIFLPSLYLFPTLSSMLKITSYLKSINTSYIWQMKTKDWRNYKIPIHFLNSIKTYSVSKLAPNSNQLIERCLFSKNIDEINSILLRIKADGLDSCWYFSIIPPLFTRISVAWCQYACSALPFLGTSFNIRNK